VLPRLFGTGVALCRFHYPALARLVYALGRQQGAFLARAADCNAAQKSGAEESPAPRMLPYNGWGRFLECGDSSPLFAATKRR
jgi:hypothetical protein